MEEAVKAWTKVEKGWNDPELAKIVQTALDKKAKNSGLEAAKATADMITWKGYLTFKKDHAKQSVAVVQKALAAAAVLENPIPAERLGKGAGLDGGKLDIALDELEWQRWLTADARGYSFVARIVRDVVGRDMVTEGQKQRIFDRVS